MSHTVLSTGLIAALFMVAIGKRKCAPPMMEYYLAIKKQSADVV
jgi:hypothetical protein